MRVFLVESDTLTKWMFVSNGESFGLPITVVVWLVADCGLPTYPHTENLKRVVTLQISTNTAINYTTGYSQFLFFL